MSLAVFVRKGGRVTACQRQWLDLQLVFRVMKRHSKSSTHAVLQGKPGNETLESTNHGRRNCSYHEFFMDVCCRYHSLRWLRWVSVMLKKSSITSECLRQREFKGFFTLGQMGRTFIQCYNNFIRWWIHWTAWNRSVRDCLKIWLSA